MKRWLVRVRYGGAWGEFARVVVSCDCGHAECSVGQDFAEFARAQGLHAESPQLIAEPINLDPESAERRFARFLRMGFRAWTQAERVAREVLEQVTTAELVNVAVNRPSKPDGATEH